MTRLGLARSIVQGLCFLTSLIFRGKIAYIKPGTTARTFGPSQLWPRVANAEGEAEVVVAAAHLLAAQRIHSGKSRMFLKLNDKTIDATTWIILCDYFNI